MCVYVCIWVCVRLAGRSWDRDTVEEEVGTTGGEVTAGSATVEIKPDTFDETHTVNVKHERASEEQQPAAVIQRIGGEDVQLADRLTIAVQPKPAQSASDQDKPEERAPLESQSSASNSTSMVASFRVDPPKSKPHPEVVKGSGESNAYQRVTDELDAKIVDSDSGEKRLMFNVPVEDEVSVFRLIWLRCKEAAIAIKDKLVQAVKNDEQPVPLHVRLHYQCDALGYPCLLWTTIGTGLPPRPEDDQKQRPDGFHTALCEDHSYLHLLNNSVDGLTDTVVHVEPFEVGSGLEMRSGSRSYGFKKSEKGNCIRLKESVGVTSKSVGKWKVRLQLELNRTIVGGNVVLVIQKQVRLHVRTFIHAHT